MATESRSQVYERGLQLAEEGKHAEALEHICAHLTEHPADSQALNDAGVILFCQGRNEEAIEHLEKAKRTAKTSELAEINWNLCEVYLAAGCTVMQSSFCCARSNWHRARRYWSR